MGNLQQQPGVAAVSTTLPPLRTAKPGHPYLWHGSCAPLPNGIPDKPTGNWFTTERCQAIYHVLDYRSPSACANVFKNHCIPNAKHDEKAEPVRDVRWPWPWLYQYRWRRRALEGARLVNITNVSDWVALVHHYNLQATAAMEPFNSANALVAKAMAERGDFDGWLMPIDQREVMLIRPSRWLRLVRAFQFDPTKDPQFNAYETQQYCDHMAEIHTRAQHLETLADTMTPDSCPDYWKISSASHDVAKAEEKLHLAWLDNSKDIRVMPPPVGIPPNAESLFPEEIAAQRTYTFQDQQRNNVVAARRRLSAIRDSTALQHPETCAPSLVDPWLASQHAYFQHNFRVETLKEKTLNWLPWPMHTPVANYERTPYEAPHRAQYQAVDDKNDVCQEAGFYRWFQPVSLVPFMFPPFQYPQL